ncbi:MULTISPECIES: hypothetical protein [Flavobacterium]|uniref:Transcriptional regulator n=1 Tax=Flavobacterium jumunjinense TaxID=998845 RepID=A0ABV5GQ13_9FLAO|nr:MULTISPECIES: hypothetical protein [Flavobacterium]
MTKIKERIIYFIENQGFKKGEFFKEIEVSSANFRGNALKTPLNSSTIENIITIYPQLNLHWLITGKGDMLLESKDSSNKPSTNIATNVETATNIATNVETATKREIYLSEEVIALLKEKISDLEKNIEALRSTSNTIERLTRIENKLDTSLETNKTLFSEIEEYFELMKLKENLEKAKNIETHRESKK